MIAYIEKPIRVKNMDEEILNDMGIYHNDTEILPQKIQLNELDMNWFFSEMLLDEVTIEYSWYGGEGCQFAFTIKGK